MKKRLLLFFLFGTITASSQSFGVKTGLALTNYKATSKMYAIPGGGYIPPTILGQSVQPGFLFGGYIDIGIKKNLFIRPGAELVVKGAIEKGRDNNNPGYEFVFNYGYKFATIDFPVNLLYKSGQAGTNRWLAGGGIVPGIILETDLNRGDFGLNAVVGYEFPIGLNFNLNFTQGLLNVAGETSYRYSYLRNQYFAITMGYFF